MTPEEHIAAAEQLVDEATAMPIGDQLSVHLQLAQLHIGIANAAAILDGAGNLARCTDLAAAEHERIADEYERIAAARAAVAR